VQGVLADGTEFQVSLPIDRGARVVVHVEPADRSEVRGLPAWCTKATRAAEAALDVLDVGPHLVRVERSSDLPVAKGLGSSSADIVATARAVAAAFGRSFAADELAALAGAIEPSDPVMHEGVVASRRRGGILCRWDWSPTFTVAVLVPVAYATTPARAASRDRPVADDDLLHLLESGVRDRDPAPFVAAARTSARRSSRAADPIVERTAAHVGRLGALGLNVAHTGTATGLLFPDTGAGRAAAAAAVDDAVLTAGLAAAFVAVTPARYAVSGLA
jgi:uncharacterized protein involved in propanediol utilization